MNIMDALTMLARSFGARIFYSNGTYHFQRINDLYTGMPLVSTYLTGDYPETQSRSTVHQDIGARDDDNEGYWVSDVPNVTINSGHKQEKIDLDYKKSGLLQNYAWAALADGKFNNWEAGTYKSQSNQDDPAAWDIISQHGAGTVDNPYSCFLGQDGTYIANIRQAVIDVIPGFEYSVGCKFKFYGVKSVSYTVMIYQDTVDYSAYSTMYFDGVNWQHNNGVDPRSGARRIAVLRQSDIRKNDLDFSISLPKIPNTVYNSGGTLLTLAPNIIEVFFHDPDGAVNDGSTTAGVEIGPVELGSAPYGYTGETDTVTAPESYQTMNDDSDAAIIDGYDAFANSLRYGEYGVYQSDWGYWSDDFINQDTIKAWLDTLDLDPITYETTLALFSYEIYQVKNIRGIINQNASACQQITGTLFSNSITFDKVIRYTFNNKRYIQMSDEYDVKACMHAITLFELLEPIGFLAKPETNYKF